LIQFNDLSTFS